jgi:hypothetical protein
VGAREEVEVLIAAEQLGAAELAQLLCRESEPSTLHFFQFLAKQSNSRVEIEDEEKRERVYRRWCNGKARQGTRKKRREDEKGLKKEKQEGGGDVRYDHLYDELCLIG